jgi:hypothetical protein
MADNVVVNSPTTTGATIATDEIASVQHQLVKLEYGEDGSATMVSPTNPLPVITDTPLSVNHAKVTVVTAGVSVQFGTNTTKSIVVKASTSNTGVVYVGGSVVSVINGFPLLAGDTISIDISNSDIIWIDSSVNGDSVNWLSNN